MSQAKNTEKNYNSKLLDHRPSEAKRTFTNLIQWTTVFEDKNIIFLKGQSFLIYFNFMSIALWFPRYALIIISHERKSRHQPSHKKLACWIDVCGHKFISNYFCNSCRAAQVRQQQSSGSIARPTAQRKFGSEFSASDRENDTKRFHIARMRLELDEIICGLDTTCSLSVETSLLCTF